MSEGITFSASLAGVRTTVDGGWRVTLDVPASEASSLLELAKLRDQAFSIGVVPFPLGQKIEGGPRWQKA